MLLFSNFQPNINFVQNSIVQFDSLDEQSYYDLDNAIIEYQDITNENSRKNENTNQSSSTALKPKINEYDNKIIIDITDNNKNGKSLNKRGRKRKSEIRNAKNTKYRKDNEMKKIKAYLINFIFDNLNSRLTFSHKKFLKINKNVNENLEREFNINLMNMTIKEIFEKFSVNNKYSKSIKRKNLNQELIMEIYEKNKENKVIELLNSKYIDQLKNLRNNYLDKFVRDMHEKSKNNNDNDLEKYINELKQLLFDYEFWFENKKPRVKRRKENI